MNEAFKFTGSFATIWLATWIILFLLLSLAYPLVRRGLLRCHPATSSNILLVLLFFPFLTSLLSTAFLFSPLLESNIFSDHVHTADCYEHFPYLNSFWLISSVLTVSSLVLLIIFKSFLSNLKFSRQLMSQLSACGKKKEPWHVLPQQESLVFTLGWLKNTIFITEGLLQNSSNQDIDIILDHEKEHIKRKDNLRLLLARLLTIFIPSFVAQKYIKDLHLFTEAACDFSSALKHGSVNVAKTLLHVQRLVPQEFTYCNATLLSSFTGSEIESRIELLLQDKRPANPLKYTPVFYFLILLLLSLTLVDPLHHSVEWVLSSG